MIPRGPRSLVHHSTVAVAILATSLAHALQTAPEEQDEATRGTGVVAKGAPQKVAAEYTNRHALLIGISDYADPNFQDLAYADDDARGMAEVLTQQLGFPKENVRLLLDKDASQAAIREALQDWSADKKRIGENDLYVLFYAGHGWTRDVNGKNVGLIVPQDARMKSAEEPVWSSFVPMSELELASETIPARHAAFILDCCFSGLVFATHRAGPALAGMSNRARQVLTAGNDEQQVQDGGTGSHSVFTAALIDGLRGNADGNGDAVIGFGELFQYVGNRVQDESSRPQTPAQAMLPDHNGGAVAFYAPGTMNQAKPPEDRLALLQSTAAQSTRELRALADLSRSSDLLDEYDQLWPLLPEEIGRMRTWIGRCDELLQRLRDHEDLETKQRQRIFLEQSVAKLLPEDATQPRWSEASEFDVWQHKSWTKLVAQIRELSQLKPSVLARIEQAGWLEEYSLGVHARAWAACIQSVESLPAYQGLRLTPQVGLVPKRMNPESGLWEFHHVQSSWTTDTCVQDTTRSPDLSSSLVFALIPAGEFRRHPGWDGRLPQAIRPLPNEIPPFFLSTRQMNVRQASAFCGSRPQSWRALAQFNHSRSVGSLVDVNYVDSVELLRRMGLRMPSEVEWEYVASRSTVAPSTDGSSVNSSPARAWGSIGTFDKQTTCHRLAGVEHNQFGIEMLLVPPWEWCAPFQFISRRAPQRRQLNSIEAASLLGLDSSSTPQVDQASLDAKYTSLATGWGPQSPFKGPDIQRPVRGGNVYLSGQFSDGNPWTYLQLGELEHAPQLGIRAARNVSGPSTSHRSK